MQKTRNAKNNLKRIWTVSQFQISKDNTQICGIIQYGEGGTREDIVDIETKNKEFEKTTKQAGLMNFYFMVYIPENSDIGYLILQRIQNKGIKGIFLEICNEITDNGINRYTILLDNIFSKEYFKRLQKNWLPKEIRVTAEVQHNPSSDLADYKSENQSNKIHFTTKIEYLLKIRYDQNITIFNKIIDKIFHQENVPAELFHEANLPDNPDQISIVVMETTKNVHGRNRRRTIKIIDSDEEELSLEDMLLPYHDITDNVEYDIDGYPTFDSINNEAKKYLKELIHEKNQI